MNNVRAVKTTEKNPQSNLRVFLLESLRVVGVSYLIAKVIIFEVAALPDDPANCQTTLQEPTDKVLIVARVKIPPVLSWGTTEAIVQIAGVADVSVSRSPMLNNPEFCPFA